MQLLSFLFILPLLFATTVSAECDGASTWISFVTTNGSLSTPERQLSISTGGYVYFGSIRYSGQVEPLITNYPGGRPGAGAGGMSFTNYRSGMTGWRNAYVFPNLSAPLSFTMPHSGFVPEGADLYGFTVGKDDRLLRYRNFDGWYACPTPNYQRTYIIYYVGDGIAAPKECVKIDIPTQGYGKKDWPKENLDGVCGDSDL